MRRLRALRLLGSSFHVRGRRWMQQAASFPRQQSICDVHIDGSFHLAGTCIAIPPSLPPCRTSANRARVVSQRAGDDSRVGPYFQRAQSSCPSNRSVTPRRTGSRVSVAPIGPVRRRTATRRDLPLTRSGSPRSLAFIFRISLAFIFQHAPAPRPIGSDLNRID